MDPGIVTIKAIAKGIGVLADDLIDEPNEIDSVRQKSDLILGIVSRLALLNEIELGGS